MNKQKEVDDILGNQSILKQVWPWFPAENEFIFFFFILISRRFIVVNVKVDRDEIIWRRFRINYI